jgi:predicted TIM-barrel fold metal-dependent hydrolase
VSGISLFSRRTLFGLIPAALAQSAEPVLDIHQHTNYSGRTDEQLRAHQRTMGIAQTILLPAGSKYGLAAGCGGNDTVVALAKAYPKEFLFFANELPDIPETKPVLERYLKAGAIGIGEQKFHVECDSKAMQLVADIAKHHGVPVLMHFQHNVYNLGFERFHRMLEMYPTVNFIGHAQTWWGNIDKNHNQAAMYPKGPVTPGGITDRLLSEYSNMYGDLSAGSGLNALLRDEDHARDFLTRHQDKLLYGSDCNDKVGAGKACSGSQQLATVRRLAPDAQAIRKMLYENAARLLKIS